MNHALTFHTRFFTVAPFQGTVPFRQIFPKKKKTPRPRWPINSLLIYCKAKNIRYSSPRRLLLFSYKAAPWPCARELSNICFIIKDWTHNFSSSISIGDERGFGGITNLSASLFHLSHPIDAPSILADHTMPIQREENIVGFLYRDEQYRGCGDNLNLLRFHGIYKVSTLCRRYRCCGDLSITHNLKYRHQECFFISSHKPSYTR